MHKFCFVTLLSALPLFASCAGPSASSNSQDASTMSAENSNLAKEDMIFNVFRFVTLPNPSDTEIRLGLYGDDPFFVRLKALDGRKIESKTFRVVKLNTASNAENVDAVYVGSSYLTIQNLAVSDLAPHKVFTISSNLVFASGYGGMLAIKDADNGKYRMEFNLSALKAAGITVSARLLNISDIVGQ